MPAGGVLRVCGKIDLALNLITLRIYPMLKDIGFLFLKLLTDTKYYDIIGAIVNDENLLFTRTRRVYKQIGSFHEARIRRLVP